MKRTKFVRKVSYLGLQTLVLTTRKLKKCENGIHFNSDNDRNSSPSIRTYRELKLAKASIFKFCKKLGHIIIKIHFYGLSKSPIQNLLQLESVKGLHQL